MVAMTIRRQISMAEVVLSVCALIVSEAILDGHSLHPSDSNRIRITPSVQVCFVHNFSSFDSRISDKCPG